MLVLNEKGNKRLVIWIETTSKIYKKVKNLNSIFTKTIIINILCKCYIFKNSFIFKFCAFMAQKSSVLIL